MLTTVTLSRAHTSTKGPKVKITDTSHLHTVDFFSSNSMNHSLMNKLKCRQISHCSRKCEKVSGSVPLYRPAPKVNGVYSGLSLILHQVWWKCVQYLCHPADKPTNQPTNKQKHGKHNLLGRSNWWGLVNTLICINSHLLQEPKYKALSKSSLFQHILQIHWQRDTLLAVAHHPFVPLQLIKFFGIDMSTSLV